TNYGDITQIDETAIGEGPYDGVGILISAETFSGSITNGGNITGLAGPAIWITDNTQQFSGGIFNSGGNTHGADESIRIQSENFEGGLYNSGYIIASSGSGVSAATNWSGNVLNVNLIEGAQGGGEGSNAGNGFEFVGNGNYEGDFENAGTIRGGLDGVRF